MIASIVCDTAQLTYLDIAPPIPNIVLSVIPHAGLHMGGCKKLHGVVTQHSLITLCDISMGRTAG